LRSHSVNSARNTAPCDDTRHVGTVTVVVLIAASHRVIHSAKPRRKIRVIEADPRIKNRDRHVFTPGEPPDLGRPDPPHTPGDDTATLLDAQGPPRPCDDRANGPDGNVVLDPFHAMATPEQRAPLLIQSLHDEGADQRQPLDHPAAQADDGPATLLLDCFRREDDNVPLRPHVAPLLDPSGDGYAARYGRSSYGVPITRS